MSQTITHFETTYPSTESLSDDDRYEILSAARRRAALAVLENEARRLSLRSLASAVAKEEEGVDAEDTRAIDRVAVSLHHSHLPKMAAFGVVEYDPSSKEVTLA
jgi:hypothetical protein